MIIYKYVSRLDIIENASIRFSQAGALNDPFETTPCYSEFREHMLQTLAEKNGGSIPLDMVPNLMPTIDGVLSSVSETLGNYFVILSLTKTNNNGLMWAHYANSHKGYVIGFDSENSFFQPGNGKANDGLRDVKYSTNRAVVPRTGLNSLSPEELALFNEQFFFTKSSDWSYEEEVRILAHPAAASDCSKEFAGYKVCLFNFPKDCIKEIILGCKMPLDERKKFVETVKKDYPHAKIFQAKLNDKKFDLDVIAYIG